MGVSTDGIIAYGFSFDEDTEFPWNTEQYDDGINDWWIETVHGYKPPFEMYDADGEYINGIEPHRETIEKYYRHRRDFETSIPKLPVRVVEHCSNDYPMYILAIPETVLEANRGYPQPIPVDLIQNNDGWDEILKSFCDEYNIDIDGLSPAWWLASYWG